jgi:transposase
MSNKKYTEELKDEALKLIIGQGRTQHEVSDLLAIPKGTLGTWVRIEKNKLQDMAPGKPSVSDVMAENTRLRNELKKANMEKEILKKAAAYFAKESL